MDSPAITSAAQAVHQELVRKLAEQARINRLRDQLRRPRPGPAAGSPARPGTLTGSPARPGTLTASPAGPGTAIPAPGGRADWRARTQPDAGSWLAPAGSWLAPAASRPFAAGFSGEPAAFSGVPPVRPVPGGSTGVTGPDGTVTLNPPTPPA